MTQRYEIEMERVAIVALAKIHGADQRRIMARIESLATDPRPANATKMVGADAYRVRQGNYRIVYLVDDAVRIVTVTKVGHRREIYREKR